MPQSAALLCQDDRSIQILKNTFQTLGIEPRNCRSQQDALESVMQRDCTTLVVDFDLPGAEEVIRMAALLPEEQKPVLLAVASRAWPGTGQAFQSGASRILYKPIDPELIKESLKMARKASKGNRRKSARYEVKTLVYLELETGTLPGVSIDIGEQGMAVQATDPVPIGSNIPFRCVLPGTNIKLHGHADVIWASDQGRAGLFFSKLSPAVRKQLKIWLHKRSNHNKEKHALRDLLPGAEEHVSFMACGEEIETV
jgi:FixJ family two-component response regulator